MPFSKLALFASVAILLAAGIPYADQARALEEGQAIHVSPTGKTKIVKVTPKGHEAVMKDAKPLPTGGMIYRSGGKVHFTEDKKMPSGNMMSQDQENMVDFQSVGTE